MDIRLENRYFVLKNKDLTEEQSRALKTLVADFKVKEVDCVCIESNWPMYDDVVTSVVHMALHGADADREKPSDDVEEFRKLFSVHPDFVYKENSNRWEAPNGSQHMVRACCEIISKWEIWQIARSS